MSHVEATTLIRRFFRTRRKYGRYLGHEVDLRNCVRIHSRTFEELEVNRVVDQHDYAKELNDTGFTFSGHPLVVSEKTKPGQFYFMPLFHQDGPIRFVGGPRHGQTIELAAWPVQAVSKRMLHSHWYELQCQKTELGTVYYEYVYSHSENVLGRKMMVEPE